MKFTLVPVALLAAFAASGAVAQDSSSMSSSMSMSSSASGSMSSSSSGAQPTSMSSSSMGGGSNAQYCTVLGGDPRAQPHGCPYSSTSTPPYNREYFVQATNDAHLAENISSMLCTIAKALLFITSISSVPMVVISSVYTNHAALDLG